MIIWIMGLAGSGKTTLAKKLCEKLPNSISLDGDEFREIFGKYGYDKASRIEVAKQKAKLANALSKQGYIVICTAISLFNENYAFNRNLSEKYIEIYLKCDFSELVRRNQKELYTRALNSQIQNVVGIDIKFDEPNADLTIDNTDFENTEENINLIIRKIYETR